MLSVVDLGIVHRVEVAPERLDPRSRSCRRSSAVPALELIRAVDRERLGGVRPAGRGGRHVRGAVDVRPDHAGRSARPRARPGSRRRPAARDATSAARTARSARDVRRMDSAFGPTQCRSIRSTAGLPPAVRSDQAGLTMAAAIDRRSSGPGRWAPGSPSSRSRRATRSCSTTSTRLRSSAARPRIRDGLERRAAKPRPRRRLDRRLGRRAPRPAARRRVARRTGRRAGRTSSSRPRSRTSSSSGRSSGRSTRADAGRDPRRPTRARCRSPRSPRRPTPARARPRAPLLQPGPGHAARRGRRDRRDGPGRRRARDRAHDRRGARSRSAAPTRPGFIVNRVNRPFTLEALRDPRGGRRVASRRSTPRCARAGFPMGPFELMDLVGHRRQPRRGAGVWDAACGRTPTGSGRRRSRSARRGGPARAQDRAAGSTGTTGRADRRGAAPAFDAARHRRSRRRRSSPSGSSSRSSTRRIARVGEGVATRDDIDLAMRLGAGHPTGPFERAEAWAAASVALASTVLGPGHPAAVGALALPSAHDPRPAPTRPRGLDRRGRPDADRPLRRRARQRPTGRPRRAVLRAVVDRAGDRPRARRGRHPRLRQPGRRGQPQRRADGRCCWPASRSRSAARPSTGCAARGSRRSTPRRTRSRSATATCSSAAASSR